MLDLAKADEYFALHLRKSEWSAKSEEERSAALSMAGQDISLELGGTELDYANPFAVGAVCEQALFLLTSPEEGINPVSALIQSESVDGIGSRTYRSRANPAIASRAERFLEQLRGRPGAIRTSRG